MPPPFQPLAPLPGLLTSPRGNTAVNYSLSRPSTENPTGPSDAWLTHCNELQLARERRWAREQGIRAQWHPQSREAFPNHMAPVNTFGPASLSYGVPPGELQYLGVRNRPSSRHTRPRSSETHRHPVEREVLFDQSTIRDYAHRRIRRSAPNNSNSLDKADDGRPAAKEAPEMTVKLDCKICMSQLVDTVIMPCGHAVLCRWCADIHIPPLQGDRTRSAELVKCPICRNPVERKVRRTCLPASPLVLTTYVYWFSIGFSSHSISGIVTWIQTIATKVTCCCQGEFSQINDVTWSIDSGVLLRWEYLGLPCFEVRLST